MSFWDILPPAGKRAPSRGPKVTLQDCASSIDGKGASRAPGGGGEGIWGEVGRSQ